MPSHAFRPGQAVLLLLFPVRFLIRIQSFQFRTDIPQKFREAVEAAYIIFELGDNSQVEKEVSGQFFLSVIPRVPLSEGS